MDIRVIKSSYGVCKTNNNDIKAFTNTIVFILLLCLLSLQGFAQFTCTSSIGASQEEWDTFGAWSCDAGFNPNEGYPDNDYDEDAETTAANGDHGQYIIVDTGDNIKIPNNTIVDLSNSNVTRVTLKANSELHFGSNAKLILPSGAEMVFESGAQMIADNNSSGTYLEIGGNGVWGRECSPECNNGTLTGPGTIDEDSDPSSPLPIDLLLFSIKNVENGVLVQWITASEENNDYFTIERSQDGLSFESISNMGGAGNSTSQLSYEFLDKNALFGRSYYRLKQTDYDGQSETFKAKSIYVTALSDIHISPNPVERGKSLTIYTGVQSGENAWLKLYNAAGVMVYQQTLDVGTNTMKVGNEIEPGFYVIKVKSGETQSVKRLLVK